MLCRSVSASYTNEKLLDSAGNVTGYTGDYEKGNLPTRFTMYPDRVVNYEYDRLDRLTMRYFVNGGVPVYNSYQYYVRQNAPSESNVVYRTTQLLREIVDNTGYTYTYDDVGNILTVKTSQRLYPNTSNVEIGEHSDYRSYSYDNKYQLTRENNVTSGKTTVWGYDGLGNITSKTEYPYTQGALGTALSTVNYTYSNDGKNGWNKLLTAVGNETVTYDAIGNPTSYLGASLSWFGRKLQSYEKGNTNVTYTYDAGGSRASKTVNGTKSEFVYLDGKLVYEKRGGDDIFYLYDSYGSLSNIRWYKNGASSPTNIYVITNRQGDVLGLYDYAGTRKVSYEYDAWGNTVSVTDTSQDNWSTLNPFRYRGYYFDIETGLYYLLSRYYDPAVGRFLNADGFVSTGQGVLGNNMFAYCNNNPVAFSDSTGTRRVGALEKYKDSGIGRGTYDKSEPYKTADDAAKAFSEQVYSSSSYIRYEYSTEIYSRTVNGKTTYNYNTPRVGEPHSSNVGAPTPSGTKIVAYAHTHPNTSFFSPADKNVSQTMGIDAYVVGPNLELQRYSYFSASITNIGTISPIALTDAQRSALVAEFQVLWDAHVAAGCEFNCGSMTWPTR